MTYFLQNHTDITKCTVVKFHYKISFRGDSCKRGRYPTYLFLCQFKTTDTFKTKAKTLTFYFLTIPSNLFSVVSKLIHSFIKTKFMSGLKE